MRIRFWGVRGSTPTPQRDNLVYGGNTSCVEVRTGNNEILIFDAGTGIRLLGKALEQEFNGSRIRAHLFLSHFHIDHIQGLPFFTPLYAKDNHFTFYFAGRRDANLVKDALEGNDGGPVFPRRHVQATLCAGLHRSGGRNLPRGRRDNPREEIEPSARLCGIQDHTGPQGYFLLHRHRTRSRME